MELMRAASTKGDVTPGSSTDGILSRIDSGFTQIFDCFAVSERFGLAVVVVKLSIRLDLARYAW